MPDTDTALARRANDTLPAPAEQSKEPPKGKPKKLSPEELREQLDAKTQLIQMRVEAIQNEITSIPEEAKQRAQHAVFGNLWAGVGGSLGLGLLVGLLVGKPKPRPTALSKALEYVPSSQRHLAERYVADFEGVLRRAEKRGEDLGEAARDFLGRHAPPVIVTVEDAEKKGSGLVGALGGIVLTLLSAAAKTAIQAAVTGAVSKEAAEEGSRDANREAQRA